MTNIRYGYKNGTNPFDLEIKLQLYVLFCCEKDLRTFLSRKRFTHFVRKLFAHWILPSWKFRLFGPLLYNNLHKSNLNKIQQEQWLTDWHGKAMIGLQSDKKIGMHNAKYSEADMLCCEWKDLSIEVGVAAGRPYVGWHGAQELICSNAPVPCSTTRPCKASKRLDYLGASESLKGAEFAD